MSHKLPETVQPLLDELRAERFEQDIEQGFQRNKEFMANVVRGTTGYTLMEKYKLLDVLPMERKRQRVFEGIKAASED